MSRSDAGRRRSRSTEAGRGGRPSHKPACIDPLQRLREMQKRWAARRDQLAAVRASVPGATLCELVLADLTSLIRRAENDLLNLTEAAHQSGYTREHLGRLVALGAIPNAGRPNAPRVRVADLPRKPGYLPPAQADDQIVGASKAAVVRSIANSQKRSLR